MNGAWSTAIVIGTQPPPALFRILKPLPCVLGICGNGIASIASTWPPSSAFTRALSSGMSMTVTWSKYGCPVRQ